MYNTGMSVFTGYAYLVKIMELKYKFIFFSKLYSCPTLE
jgi:hypothetical protein